MQPPEQSHVANTNSAKSAGSDTIDVIEDVNLRIIAASNPASAVPREHRTKRGRSPLLGQNGDAVHCWTTNGDAAHCCRPFWTSRTQFSSPFRLQFLPAPRAAILSASRSAR